MKDETVGFQVKQPVSAWNLRLDVDYPGLFKGLLKALALYSSGHAAGGIGATLDAAFAFKLESKHLDPAAIAWHLIRRSLAHAMARLAIEVLQDRLHDLGSSESLVEELDKILEETEVRIDPAFFEYPNDIAIIEPAKSLFQQWLKGCDLEPVAAESVVQRLASYFTFALHQEWADNTDFYRPVEVALTEANTPFARAGEKERAWLKNAAFLKRQVKEPIFEESFGLEKVYVPLRGWHRHYDESAGKTRQSTENRDIFLVDLKNYMSSWFEEADRLDPIRVICGGPGSGKSSFVRIWAAALAEDSSTRVLYVPLHRVSEFERDAQQALVTFLNDWKILPHDPLDADEGERRLLILFDGLDELAMQGQAGRELALDFVRSIKDKVERINDQGRLLQVVFAGRDVVAEAARNVLNDANFIHILSYHDSTLSVQYNIVRGKELLNMPEYSCDHWWQRFGRATGHGFAKLPETLQRAGLKDLTAQPLLNYLVALSFCRNKLDFDQDLTLNSIYEDLLDSVYERRWGEGIKRHPTTTMLSRENFDSLLEEMALAAWHGAGRVVTEVEVERSCDRAGLRDELVAFKHGSRAGAINLLAAFYFRQAGRIEGGERTFEFTHKSFSEYLVARRLKRTVDDIHEERSRNRNNRKRGWTEDQALTEWIRLTGPEALEPSIIRFLDGEFATMDKALAIEQQKTIVELFSDQLHHGLPMTNIGLSAFNEMVRQARNAEEALLIILARCAKFTNECCSIDWPSSSSSGDLMRRLRQGPDQNANYGRWRLLEPLSDDAASNKKMFYIYCEVVNCENSNIQITLNPDGHIDHNLDDEGAKGDFGVGINVDMLRIKDRLYVRDFNNARIGTWNRDDRE